MPLHYRVDEARGIVVVSLEGKVTSEELMQHARALRADTRASGLHQIIDMSDRDQASTPPDGVRRLAEFMREHGNNTPGRKVALVAASPSVYGTARLFAAHRQLEAVRVQVFEDRAAALAWLGEST